MKLPSLLFGHCCNRKRTILIHFQSYFCEKKRQKVILLPLFAYDEPYLLMPGTACTALRNRIQSLDRKVQLALSQPYICPASYPVTGTDAE